MNFKKIKTRFLLKKILEKEKKKRKKIVLTNGVFDILHIGHIRYLQASKKLGDILVVALNSDKSTKRFKGLKRPIVPEKERAEVISSLDCVDYVLIFNETTAEKTIRCLKPDVYTKGGDHKIKDITEAPLVSLYGGKVKLLPVIDSHSVTILINKILQENPQKFDQKTEYQILHKKN